MKFYRLSWITTVIIGIQMVLAGIIVGEDAGFVCPKWPVCGRPVSMSGSLIFELVHRFTAGLLGILVVWLLIWLFLRYRHNRAMIWTGVLGLVSLIIQIVYAGLIVLFVLPGTATTVDVLNSVIMLSLFVHLSNLAKHEDEREHGVVAQPDSRFAKLKPAAWVLYASGMVAVAAGAVFRHTGASQALFGEDSYILSHGQHVPPSHATSETLLIIHIVTAALLMLAGIWFVERTFAAKRLTKAAGLTLICILIQGGLGIASLQTRLQTVVVTTHWAVAGLIMGVIAFALSRIYIGLSGAKAPAK
ncbi:COX15/CtaA family protein [Alicyclobacillus cycloheptanicus]|uniref:Cytochrome c oxidase assembly protein subunit 15 n=1 Tax=Alicyclobacillus cycloheptanicus TaxID=1457 RepID=A0ABT9XKL6_9BACL|nr:COX15/CtaA family protein [Alicyclobacillus cycloheptanicus]MDQ0190815.1 cytochrome c oxidase assembly protein subunit 15 [Alicyclobacillus cycloheptanicus]WDM02706.1 COX15/CtaA family protein [Alicyclobacillus cycloheptanicus]